MSRSHSPATLDAAHIWGAAKRLRADIGSPMPPAQQHRYESGIQTARACGNHAAFEAAWHDGSTMTLEQAVA